jgi:hypothetical protein
VTGLRTYTRLRPERREERRDEGRVQQERMKPRPGEITPEQGRYHESLRRFPDGRNRPCQCGCGRIGEDLHHLLARAPGKGPRRDHWFVVLLAKFCHNLGRDSVHMLGSEAAFKKVHGVDLVKVAVDNLKGWTDGR